MSDPCDFPNLSDLAGQLSNPAVPLDQRLDAVGELERRLTAAPTFAADAAESRSQFARASLLAKVSRLEALPELDALKPMLDAGTMQVLRTLCDRPMSLPLLAEIESALDAATAAARNASARLAATEAEVQRLRRYRSVLQDMLDLMTILASDDPEVAAHDAT